ncbi:MAG: hypothetical protein NZO16_01165 [Deltaproteobacteria bacterium]|nr:hypothetical protein [Deltaproteobacteria bacterium]
MRLLRIFDLTVVLVTSFLFGDQNIDDQALSDLIKVENMIGRNARDVLVRFRNSATGVIEEKRLSQLVSGRPTILLPIYFKCPSICGPLTQEALKFANNSRFIAGSDYNLFIYSFNPEDSIDLAHSKKLAFLADCERKNLNVEFLVSTKDEIDKFLDSIGFRVKKVGIEYAHPPAFYVLDKNLRITHIFKTTLLDFKSVDLALVSASDSKLGSFVDTVRLFCYSFDPQSGKYTLVAIRVMQLVGALTLLFLGGLLFWLWRKEG